ncbi:hypothetical protein GTP56_08440 [Duganella sp. FT134W]|uniref:Uncharacterized protein n=1 Tax=Duganella margarita TaxID=2692170 RepID=A0A7X4GYV7_9BURK|nr:hypothetical protein [Duganella margarita]MYM72223.1 hypothetical protein [Duganella margarita]
MAINVTSTSNANPVQLNLRETRANRAEQRSEQAGETRRTEQSNRSQKDDAVLKQRVKENTEATRSASRNNDQAAADRRAVQQADKQADAQRRDSDKALGRNIDTTA